MSLPPADRHWSTWDAARPAAMRHLPSGIAVTPLLYQASTGEASWLAPGNGVRFGRHAIDSRRVELAVTRAGSHIDFGWEKTGTQRLTGRWQSGKLGEWGLRVWITLCLTAPAGTRWRYDAATGTAAATHGGWRVTVTPERAPLLVTAHASPDALAEEFRRHGYWYLASRAAEGAVLALRFNLDEMPQLGFTVSADGPEPDLPLMAPAAFASDSFAATDAVRDIMAWNSTWDPVNARPYTSCSRNWDLSKFGGFGTWLTDTAVNALLTAGFDAAVSRENIAALLSGQTAAGNFPCLLTGHDSWIDRSQPPLVSLIIWLIYQQTGDRSLLAECYPALAANNAWWWRCRDGNGNGLLEYGSSDAGDGLYVGTKLAAKDESFMDNSPMHDEARFDVQARTLDCEDVGLNSLITLDAEILAKIAAEIGETDAAQRHAAVAETQRARVRVHFWDASRGIFANRLWSGSFVSAVTPTSFYPLLCGAADPKQTSAMLAHLDDSAMFGGTPGLPSVARSHPAFADNVYWRGRIWPILNWLIWLALKRIGAEDRAQQIAADGYELFTRSWAERLAPENFNAVTGDGLDQPDTDSFYSWTALLPHMQAATLMDFDSWAGWRVNADGPDADLGPILTPAGAVTVTRRAGKVTLQAGANVIFTTDRPGWQAVTLQGRLSRT